MSASVRLEAWFLHEERVFKMVRPEDQAAFASRISDDPFFGPLSRRHALEAVLERVLETGAVASLVVARIEGSLRPGNLVWLDQALYYKGSNAAHETKKAESAERVAASFSGKLNVDDSVTVTGDFNVVRITGSTGVERLSGRRRHYIVGFIDDLTDDQIQLRPIFIGSRLTAPDDVGFQQDIYDTLKVFPSRVDQFHEVDFTSRLTKKDLEQLRDVPESQVKGWFAEIIGEPEVPKDWGGEQFDLWSSRLTIDGQPMHAAFAFKGPAKFHPMVIADLGKNGDQIDRLAQTDADLLVVQHCHAITAPVVNMLAAYAERPRQPRRYLLIDGYDTLRILRHFEHL